MRLWRPLAAAGLGAALFSVAPWVAAGATQAPKALVNASMAAARHQGSVHITGISTLDGVKETLVADASVNSGQQEVVIHQGKKLGHVTGRLAGGKVYLKGDELGLTGYLGMPASAAPKYANKWIVFPPSSKSFSQISGEFTLKGAVADIALTAPFSMGGHSTVDKTPAMVVKGTTSTGQTGSPAQLYVATGADPLPVRFVVHDPSGGGKNYGQLDFSNWGEQVSVPVPAKAIPSSSVTN
jgi:hypothetical protein